MTRKDYQLIAEIIGGLVSDGALALDDSRDCFRLAEAFAIGLEKTNKAFDAQRFYQACGVHVPVFCQLTGCDNEATRWVHDTTLGKTFYFCLSHPLTIKAEETGTFRGQEVCVYECRKDCQDCQD